MKICFAAGGSGGHITPALAIADYFREQYSDTEIFFISSREKLDAEIFQNHHQSYQVEKITTGKLRRYFSFQNFRDLFYFPKGVFDAYRLLRKEKPDVVFSKGGYVGLPVGIATKLLKIPLVLHESDAVPGVANRILQKLATKVLTAFPLDFGEWVGTPVRSEIYKGNAVHGREFLNFRQEEKIILVMGGSQGAETINQLLLHSLETLLEKVCIVHLAGRGKSAAQNSTRYRSFSYLGKEFPNVLAAADIVVSRSGANSLFELAAAGKPALLVPLPSAANDHQRRNAEIFTTKNAAMILEQEKLTSAKFQEVILHLAKDEQKQQELAKNISELSSLDAVKKIVKVLLANASKSA